MEMQGIHNSQNSIEKEKQAWKLPILNFKSYYKAIINNSVVLA